MVSDHRCPEFTSIRKKGHFNVAFLHYKNNPLNFRLLNGSLNF